MYGMIYTVDDKFFVWRFPEDGGPIGPFDTEDEAIAAKLAD